MLYRKIQAYIEAYLTQGSDRVLVIDGARQVGKTFVVRHVASRLFPNYIEVNMEEDALQARLFADVRTKDDFYLALSAVAGDKMGTKEDTLVFIDEVQRYSHMLTLLKFLKEDDRYTYIASGSLLGVTLSITPSIPLGYVDIQPMYPLDFEEFLLANGINTTLINHLRTCLRQRETPAEALHNRVMDLFRKYLLAGGMPSAVNSFVADHNIAKVRSIQTQIYELYKADASRYEDAKGKLLIRRIYDMIPSNLENKKKRVVAKNIEGVKGKRMNNYCDEFEYLISSGTVLEVRAVSQPSYPLLQNSGKNLLKLYLNDVGILTALLYNNNIQPILNDVRNINLGAVYESVVAQELRAHGHTLYYYDNKKLGEVDFLIDDSRTLSVLPLEVKSGRDYRTHSAITHLLSVEQYNLHNAYVLSNARTITTQGPITYIPVYLVMFL